MSDFAFTGTGSYGALSYGGFPKVDASPLGLTEDGTKNMQAGEWNAFHDALLSLRAVLSLSGAFATVTGSSSGSTIWLSASMPYYITIDKSRLGSFSGGTATSAAAIEFTNTEPATAAGPVQNSPMIMITGQAFDYDNTISRTGQFRVQLQMLSGSTCISGNLIFQARFPNAGGSVTNRNCLTIDAVGNVGALSSFYATAVGTNTGNLHQFPTGTGQLVSTDAVQTLSNKSFSQPTPSPSIASALDTASAGGNTPTALFTYVVPDNAFYQLATVISTTTADNVTSSLQWMDKNGNVQTLTILNAMSANGSVSNNFRNMRASGSSITYTVTSAQTSTTFSFVLLKLATV